MKPPLTPTDLCAKAFCEDNAADLAALLERYPELKARVNEPVGPFDSPLITRVRSRAMLDLLLAVGADINAKSQWWAGGFGLLHGANPDLAAYAIERGAVVDVHAAARLGLMDKLRELISRDPALVHARGGDGQSPLHFASTIEVADYLLNHGADMEMRDVDHESTPAQYMVRDRQEIARHLITRGAKTDILMATALGDIERVRQHLDTDPASVRMNVSERFFPPQNPRSGGTIYIWTLGRYKTPLAIAREFGHDAIFQLLMDQSPPALQLSYACETGDEAKVRALLEAPGNLVRSLSNDDHQKLTQAAEENNVPGVRLMLEAGWPVDVRGRHGGTALHWAGFHGNAQMAEVILRYHPPLDWTDTDFNATPVGWATHGSEEGWHCRTGNYPATVEAMLKAAAPLPKKLQGTDAVQDVLRRYGVREE